MATKQHSELSPSNTERWWNCPGSVALCKGLPQRESEYAKEGICAHEVLERCLKSLGTDQGLSPYDLVGMELEEYEVTEEMAEAVMIAVDFVRTELQKGGKLYVERKITVVEGKIFGTLDIAIIKDFESIQVIDYKHGKGVLVRADDNKQLLTYLIGAAKIAEFETAELIIIQPRVMSEDKISRWTVPADYLPTFEAELLRHIELTEEKEALLNPGEWCKFCKAKATCPALRGELKTALAPVANRELVFPDVKTLSVDVIANILDYRDRIEDWMDAVAMHALGILESGNIVPGFELAKKRATRRWKDEAEVLKHFADLGEAMYKVKPLSPAQLEKLVGKERKTEVDELTEVPDNGWTIKKSGGVKADGKQSKTSKKRLPDAGVSPELPEPF